MISTIVWPQRERRRYEVTDLYQNVMDEGIRLQVVLFPTLTNSGIY